MRHGLDACGLSVQVDYFVSEHYGAAFFDSCKVSNMPLTPMHPVRYSLHDIHPRAWRQRCF